MHKRLLQPLDSSSVHTHYLPPALITSRCHFRLIKVHFTEEVALVNLRGTDQGVLSPRELQQFRISCTCSLSSPPPPVMQLQFMWLLLCHYCGADTWVLPTFSPLFTWWFHFSYRSAFLLLYFPQGYLFLLLSAFASVALHRRRAGSYLCLQSSLPITACWSAQNCCPWSHPCHHIRSLVGQGMKDLWRQQLLLVSLTSPSWGSPGSKLLAPHQELLLPVCKFRSSCSCG